MRVRGRGCKQQVIDMLHAMPDANYAEIAERCGCSREYVAYLRHSQNLPPRPRKRRGKSGIVAPTKLEPNIHAVATRTVVSEWFIDAQGNMSRCVMGE